MTTNTIIEDNGDLYSGHVADIKGSSFMNSRDSDQSEISQRLFIEIHQTDVVQKEFNV
jgi:hypothetical protein